MAKITGFRMLINSASAIILLLLISNIFGTIQAASEHRNNGRHNHSSSHGHGHVDDVPIDNRTLDQIYQAVLAQPEEMRRAVVYANGNRAFQARTLASTIPAFQARFPGVTLDIVVDNTNPHAARANVQMANGSMVVDLVQLESVQYFYQWKREGKLLNYKPAAYESIYWEYRDPQGAFTPISATAFAMVVNTARFPNATEWPSSWADVVDQPRFRNAIIGAYPIETFSPDTTLYGYKLAVEAYASNYQNGTSGFNWIAKLFGTQNVTLLRDSSLIPAAISSGQYSLGIFRVAPGNVPNQRFILPEKDKFVGYTVLTAIFKQSPHQEAAKLYMNWQLDAQMQSTLPWTVRTDVAPSMAGFKHLWEYGDQCQYSEYVRFYLDRAGVERFRNEVYLWTGEPQGPRPTDPNNTLGIYPQ